MKLRAHTTDVITVRKNRKIKSKMRNCDGKGLPGADTVTVVSEPKVYKVSFHKRRSLDDCEFVPFGYRKGKQRSAGSQ